MIQITVAQTALKELRGNAKESGKPYHMRIQTAYAHTVDAEGNKPPFPERFEIILEQDHPAFAPGEYTLHPSSLALDRLGRMVCSPRLTPIRKPA